MRYFLGLYFLLLTTYSSGQCLETFTKIPPESTLNPRSLGFASSIDVWGNTAVVGVKHSNSQQLNAGTAFVYEFDGSQWLRTAELQPSNIVPNMKFGVHTQITENHIYVSSTLVQSVQEGGAYDPSSTSGAVYVYKKPASGWTSMTETARVELRRVSFSFGDYFQVADQDHVIGLHTDDDIYLYIRNGSEWNSSYRSVTLGSGRWNERIRNISIDEDILSISTSYEGEDIVYLKKAINNWSDFTELQKITRPSDDYFLFGAQAIIRGDQLLVNNWSFRDSVFLYLTSDNWNTIDAEEVLTSQEDLSNTESLINPNSLYMNDTLIAVGRSSNTGGTALSIYRKPDTGWGDMEEDRVIHIPPYRNGGTDSKFSITPNHLLASGNFEDHSNDNEINLLFLNLKSNPANLVNNESYQEQNSTGLDFGRNISLHEEENILAVQTYNEEREEEGINEVKLYIKNPDKTWTAINTITPGFKPDSSMNFGSAITFYDNYLAVAAPYYKENDTVGNTGRVFIYRKDGDWSNVNLIAELGPSDWQENLSRDQGLKLNFGYRIVMDENIIMIGAPGFDDPEKQDVDHGLIYVFEKQSSEEWQTSTETSRLATESIHPYSQFGRAFVLDDSCLIVPHYWNHVDSSQAISIFKRPQNGWQDGDETFLHYIEGTHFRTFNLGDIKIRGDQLFIGDPKFRGNGGSDKYGRILIFNKTGENWSEIEWINTIEFEHPVYRNVPISPYAPKRGLGVTFDVVDNLLFSGIHFLLGRGPGIFDEMKGMVPVYQALDKDWENVMQITTLEGANYQTRDAFGWKVIANKDDILIGAPEDDSPTGFNSGTVYYYSTSPTLQFVDPMCVDDGPVDLESYPTSGVWSGSGIADESENVFDPALAGPGIHEVTYSVNGCSYSAKMNITVFDRSTPVFTHPLNLYLCENDSLSLSVEPSENTSYRWRFLTEQSDQVETFTTELPQLLINRAGKYWVETFGIPCPDISDTVSVEYVPDPVNITSLPVLCDPDASIQVNVTPEGGTWLTDAVTNDNLLITSALEPGVHHLVYEYQLNTCDYSDTLLVNFDPIEQDIWVDHAELCSDEEHAIEIDLLPDAGYSLMRLENDIPIFIQEIETPTVNISGAGEYLINIGKHGCKASSNIFQIELLQDSLFAPNVVTANADQYNDQFEIYIENANYKDVSIYNRNGRLVFEDGNYQQSWPDGEYPTGVYYYVCNYSTVCNPKVSTMKGWLQLLK